MADLGTFAGNLLQEVQKSDLNAWKKIRSDQIQQAASSGASPQDILKGILSLTPNGPVTAGATSVTAGAGSGMASPPPQQAPPGQNQQATMTAGQPMGGAPQGQPPQIDLASLLNQMQQGQQGQQGGGKGQPEQKFIANPNFMGFGGPDKDGNYRDTGTGIKILQLLAGGGVSAGPQQAALVQEMLGQQAVQPLQYGQLEATKMGMKREALANEVTSYNDQLKSLTDQLNALPKTTQWVGRGTRVNNLLNNIDIVHKNLGNTIKKLRDFSSGKQEQNVPQGATHYSPSQNKYYDAQGNEVK